MSTSSRLPIGEPLLVPGGTYRATIQGEAAEQTSKFDSNRVYWTLPLNLRNQEGEDFKFVWRFGPKNPAYNSALEIIGGVTTASRKIHPPLEYVGKSFMIKIGESFSREKKLVNSVIEVWADTRRAGIEQGDTTTADAEGEKDDVPF